jgi:arylsulfatase
MFMRKAKYFSLAMSIVATISLLYTRAALAQNKKPNIVLIVSDDFGYGDAGIYGGGPGRGMPTPNLDRLADEGMTFFSFYAQPSCTPGRAAMQTGRFPNRSGMTTVAYQGQGAACPKQNGLWHLYSRKPVIRLISPVNGTWASLTTLFPSLTATMR